MNNINKWTETKWTGCLVCMAEGGRMDGGKRSGNASVGVERPVEQHPCWTVVLWMVVVVVVDGPVVQRFGGGGLIHCSNICKY